jgi:hypothetical protein
MFSIITIMEYHYMIVAFLESFEPGDVIEPPKYVHITVKKKFKLLNISEKELVQLLQKETRQLCATTLVLGESKVYNDEAFMVVEVLDGEKWIGFHEKLATVLQEVTDPRDPHSERKNYYPHVSWKVRNQSMFDPKPYFNTRHNITHFYLIQRMHQTESRVKVVAKLPLYSGEA